MIGICFFLRPLQISFYCFAMKQAKREYNNKLMTTILDNIQALLLFIVILIPSILLGQFSERKDIMGCNACNPVTIKTADLDNDGLLDIVVNSNLEKKIFWSKNLGNDLYSKWMPIEVSNYQYAIFQYEEEGADFHLVDLNGDGQIDILHKPSRADIVWFSNEGNGNFQYRHIIEASRHTSPILFPVDIDDDQDIDIVVGSSDVSFRDRPELIYYKNDGVGNFEKEQLLSLEEEYKSDYKITYVYDMDNDEDLDILLAAFNGYSPRGKTLLYENIGDGLYANAKVLYEVRDKANALETQILDIDNDGDIDIFKPQRTNNSVLIMENDGTGEFSKRTVSGLRRRNYTLGDINADGVIEILNYDQLEITIKLYDGTSLPPTGNSHRYISALEKYDPKYIQFEDINGDGNQEIIITSDPPQIAWFGTNQEGAIDTINYFNRDKLQQTFSLEVADLDGDGFKDIIFTTFNGGELGWYKNDGTTNFGEAQMIDTKTPCYSVIVRDMDNDQDLDIVCRHKDEHIYLYINEGNQRFKEQWITTLRKGVIGLRIIDIDGDQLLDIASITSPHGARAEKELVWYKNEGNNNFSHPIVIDRVHDLQFIRHIVDLDNDGKEDIIGNGRTWYQNKGNGLFSKEKEIRLAIYNPSDNILFGDIDNDGLTDFVMSYYSDRGLRWYKSNGDLSFTDMPIEYDKIKDVGPKQLVDLDNDGDLDILAGTFSTQVFWHENDGAGNFYPEKIIATQSRFSGAPYATDLNNDEQPDLIFTAREEYRIAWLENQLDHTIEGNVFWDQNGNGLLDTGEPGISNTSVSIQPEAYYTYTSSEGAFKFFLSEGNYRIIPTFLEDCWQATSDTSVFQVSVGGKPQQPLNFGYQIASDFQHTQARISPAPTRCGFTTTFHISVENDGCSPSKGQYGIVLDPLVSFLNASTMPDSVKGDTLLWNYQELIKTEVATVSLTLRMPGTSFLGAPILLEGLSYIQNELGKQELVSTYEYRSILSCAYDPNDKLVIPERASHGVNAYDQNYTLFEESLEYTVRFQNTGTDTAFTVVIEDQLDPNLEWYTFQPIIASHPYEIALDSAGLVTFTFSNILLPDSTINEPLSHGYLTYKIDPRKNLAEHTLIENTAAIFFDFNPPIITNTTQNIMVSMLPTTTSVKKVSETPLIRLFPNPFNHQLFIESKSILNKEDYQLQFFDVTGRLLYSNSLINPVLSTASWNYGLYIYRVVDKNGFIVETDKLVK